MTVTKGLLPMPAEVLSHTEHNYPAHKLEFLALKWAITDRFHEYLYGGQFDAYMDNNLLTYILTSAKLDATGQRWVASLANYDFRIFYKTGKTNVEAYALSHIPRSEHSMIDAPTVKAIIDVVPHTDFLSIITILQILFANPHRLWFIRNQEMIGKQNKRPILILALLSKP